MSAPYARDHDGRLPFAPVRDLEALRYDAATTCVILMDLRDFMADEYRQERIAEAVTLARYFDALLTAAIYRRAAEDAARREARVAS